MIGVCKDCGKAFETTTEEAYNPECRCSECYAKMVAKRDNRLVTICAQCKRILGSKDPKGAQPGVSHGLCAQCQMVLYPVSAMDIWRRGY